MLPCGWNLENPARKFGDFLAIDEMPCKNTDCMLDFGKLKWKGIFLIVYDMCLYHTNSSPSTSSYKRLEVINPSINKC